MDWSEISGDDWVKILVYGTVATSLAIGLPRLFRGNAIAAFGALLVWVAILFGVVAAYAYRFELRAVSERVLAVLIPGTAVDIADREVMVMRRTDGQFIVNATVGGRLVPFVLDTGASTVVIRAEDAARLKVKTRQLTFDVEVSTANGHTLAAEIELPRLSIGAITQTRVKALVAKPGALNQNLLGMSFLNGLASFTVSDDRLVMRAR